MDVGDVRIAPTSKLQHPNFGRSTSKFRISTSKFLISTSKVWMLEPLCQPLIATDTKSSALRMAKSKTIFLARTFFSRTQRVFNQPYYNVKPNLTTMPAFYSSPTLLQCHVHVDQIGDFSRNIMRSINPKYTFTNRTDHDIH